jgi:hypothetical protein
MTLRCLLCHVVVFLIVFSSHAQADSPVEHMSYLNERDEVLRQKYMSYMSEVAHGQRARKMEKRREELIASIQNAIREGGKLRPYKGDVSLRNAYLEYWNILLHVFKEDYHKIVDMDEVAERSYDAMEAYLLAQEEVDKKVNEASAKISPAYEAFANKHNVTLTEGNSNKLNKKLDQVGKVNHYVNKMFLIYFKSGVQESNALEAIKASDINAIEQSKNSMLKYADEGLARLDTVKQFKGDGALLNACRKILEFHKVMATQKIPLLADFIIKAQEFEKLKKSFDSKPPNKRTQQEVDNFNRAVNEMNKEIGLYNKNSEAMFNARNKAVTTWEQSKKGFMDRHIPYK